MCGGTSASEAMQNKGVLRTERNATTNRMASTAISHNGWGRRDNASAANAIAAQQKNAAWSQSSLAGFHSWICGRNQRTLPTSHRANSKPCGLRTTVAAETIAESQRAMTARPDADFVRSD